MALPVELGPVLERDRDESVQVLVYDNVWLGPVRVWLLDSVSERLGEHEAVRVAEKLALRCAVSDRDADRGESDRVGEPVMGECECERLGVNDGLGVDDRLGADGVGEPLPVRDPVPVTEKETGEAVMV